MKDYLQEDSNEKQSHVEMKDEVPLLEMKDAAREFTPY